MGTSEAGVPDDEGEEQRILALSPGEGVVGEGADQQEPAQSQRQSEEESHWNRGDTGRRTDRHDERCSFPWCGSLLDVGRLDVGGQQ